MTSSTTTGVISSIAPIMSHYSLGNKSLTGLWTDYEDMPLLVEQMSEEGHHDIRCGNIGLLRYTPDTFADVEQTLPKDMLSTSIDPNLIMGREGGTESVYFDSPEEVLRATLVSPQGIEGSLATLIVRSSSQTVRFNLFFNDAPLVISAINNFEGPEQGLRALYFTIPPQSEVEAESHIPIHLESLDAQNNILAKRLVATFEYQDFQSLDSDLTTSTTSFNEAYSGTTDQNEGSNSTLIRSESTIEHFEDSLDSDPVGFVSPVWQTQSCRRDDLSQIGSSEVQEANPFDMGAPYYPPTYPHQHPAFEGNYASSYLSSNSDSHYLPYDNFCVRVDNRAILNMPQNLNEACIGWDEVEWESRRRLIQFYRHQTGNVIHAAFRAVLPEDLAPKTIVISCIWWEERNECYVTSVDTIKLLEALVGISFNVEEKNRIRRNLEGFAPETIRARESHGGRAKSGEEFFKLIMSYKRPKPRHIEKDIKVFPWRVLGSALRKIIGKYSATFVAPGTPLSMPDTAHC